MKIKIRCTKCAIREADPDFTIDKDTAFCSECATLLKLGTSREALKMEQGVPHNAAIGDDDEEEAIEETL